MSERFRIPGQDLTASSTRAWGEALDPTGSSGVSQTIGQASRLFHCAQKKHFGAHTSQIRFLGDPTAQFTEALDLAFDGTAIFGGPRSKRYALVIEDGKVKSLHVEPDNTGVNGTPIYPPPVKTGLMSFSVGCRESPWLIAAKIGTVMANMSHGEKLSAVTACNYFDCYAHSL